MSTESSDPARGLIGRIIGFSAHNKFLVLFFTVLACVAALWCMKRIPLDALPDLSETQVIIYSKWDRSPDIIEDQVTYPIVSALLGSAKVKAVRGFSDFGFSYVYVVFQDGTDLYWARSRVLESLSKIQAQLPAGVKTELGPDATGVGWVFQYALVDKTGQHDLAQLRSFQDWTLRYWLQSVPGVAEVASVGGFQKQYQVNVNPHALATYGVPLMNVVEAVRKGNNDVGARLVEFAGAEYMVRGRGYARGIGDIENIAVGRAGDGTPLLVKNVARVVVGPDIRRGVADLDGLGETVGGIVVMRQGENALNVIDRIKAKLDDIRPSLPKGMEIVITYDRSGLIHRAIQTLTHELVGALVVVSAVILIFMWHIPSALVPIVTIPVSVLLAFIPLYFFGVPINLMSLSGIAISIGVLVDGAIVEVENAYKRLEEWLAGGRPGDYHEVRLRALQEVGPSVFFSLLVIAVAFLPIFTLVDQEGRLFKPLAYTKNLTMVLAALLAITLDPALRMLFTRMDPWRFRPAPVARVWNAFTVGSYYSEEKHPVSRRLFALYEPVCRWTLRHPKKIIAAAALILATTVPVYFRLGSEFMPPLNEEVLLYMPTTMPGISVTEAQRLLQAQDKVLKSFPEVDRVFGKAGRADTATDPAPFSMMETTILLKPRHEWRGKDRFYSSLPKIFHAPFKPFWPDRISSEELVAELDKALKWPGVVNAWTMPIKARIDMMTTGVRTPVGIKIYGSDLNVIEKVGGELEKVMVSVPGTRSVYAERTAGGYFLDVDLRRDRLARYGLSVEEAQMILMSAVGGETRDHHDRRARTIWGQRALRPGVSRRYPKTSTCVGPNHGRRAGAPGSPGGVSDSVGPVHDPGRRRAVSRICVRGYRRPRRLGGYVAEAKRVVGEQVVLPSGVALVWSGQYENMIRVRERLKIVVPVTLVLIFVLLYMNTGSAIKTWIVLLTVPFSLVGTVWLLWVLDYNVSIAVWVGMIALLGLDAEMGVFMLMYLDMATTDAKRSGAMTMARLEEAVVHGGSQTNTAQIDDGVDIDDRSFADFMVDRNRS
jgi:Cu(I)/Ag(I) efflux system membrane protein CusA/SilA